jgi:hypothetical protein
MSDPWDENHQVEKAGPSLILLNKSQMQRSKRLRGIGYTAFVWSVLFGLIHIYWAFGGTLGLDSRKVDENAILFIIN